MADDNTFRREGSSRLINASGDPESTGVATDPSALLALIATNMHDGLLVAGELAAEGFFGHPGAKDAVALDRMIAGCRKEPHVVITTASLVPQL